MDRVASTPAKMVLAVLVTCAVSATALTLTYEMTRGRIAEQQRAAEERALKSVLSSAEEFEALDDGLLEDAQEAAGEVQVFGLWVGRDATGGPQGFAVRCAPRGYGGPMQLVVGLDRDGKVSGVSIITQNETPGLGTKIMTDAWFLEQFVGWDGTSIDTASKEFDSISGATKSAVGVRKGVIVAGHVYADVLAGIEVPEGGGGQ